VNLGAPLITGLCLLYFWAAMGKSAQFPLHVWLADAMEGPTPVSALIHAATMVNAGVYLVLRMHPLFELSPLALGCMSYIGALTALFAACCALRQSELKRVLAYSTVSQLGLMFLACGSTAFYAATFHLGMHALAKALLFLSAGNVVHMMHGETDMTQMGALSLKLPKTNKLFLIGVLAMAGIAPFAIFFSKDLILEEVFMGPRKELYIVGLVVSVMTAFYLTRAYWLTFKARSHKDHEHIHEAPSIMWAPISTLALCVTFAGALGCGIGDPGWLAGYLSSSGLFYASEKLSHGFHLSASTWQSLSATFMGIGYALWLYAIKKQSLEKNPLFLHRAFYLDDFYRALFVSPLKAMARFINLHIEPRLERGTLAFPAQGSWSMARQLQKCQDGQLRHYIAWMVIGFAFLISYFLSKVTHV
jgi:NADH-quinone oxidoreductase subunit L